MEQVLLSANEYENLSKGLILFEAMKLAAKDKNKVIKFFASYFLEQTDIVFEKEQQKRRRSLR